MNPHQGNPAKAYRRDNMKSTAAIVASMIRKEIRKHGIKCSVTADNYSGGHSVRVKLNDELPATVELIEEFCSQFVSGHFDGMTDCYVYNHDRKGPTVDYVFVNNEISEELRGAAQAFVNSYYVDPGIGYEYDRRVWEMLSRKDSAFWKANKPRIAA
jgi:hypothetical protein